MSISSHTSINFGEVLFDNVLRTNDLIVYSGTDVAGFPPENAIDWRDFSMFQADGGSTTTLDFRFDQDTPFSTLSTFCREYDSAGTASIELLYESSPFVYTSIVTINPTDKFVTWVDFAEVTVQAGMNVRFEFTTSAGPLLVRQLVIGTKLVFDMGQWSDINPPLLNQSVITGNAMAVNGSFLGRNRRRVEKKGSIKLEFLTQDWVRDEWNPFSIAATEHAFMHRWNPTEYPDEVAMTVGEIVAPRNTRASLMEVSMPTMFITE